MKQFNILEVGVSKENMTVLWEVKEVEDSHTNEVSNTFENIATREVVFCIEDIYTYSILKDFGLGWSKEGAKLVQHLMGALTAEQEQALVNKIKHYPVLIIPDDKAEDFLLDVELVIDEVLDGEEILKEMETQTLH